MDTDFETDEDSHLVRRSVGPVVLLLPVAFLLLAISFLKNASSPVVGPRAEPPAHGHGGDVEGWQGELVLKNGVRWRATLGPLHGDPVRQAFDSRSLAEHFDLEAGQVFKLVLTAASPGALAGEHPLPVVLDDKVVLDADGTALSLLCPESSSESAGPADPLRSLMTRSEFSVTSGESVVWILWGRPPAQEAQLVGFEGGLRLELEARLLARAQIDVALLVREQ